MAIVRPALRALQVLPTPKLEIGSVRIELPYREPGIAGVEKDGAKQERIVIMSIAHPYRAQAHPDQGIDFAVLARDALMRSSERYSDRYIETDLATALRGAGPEAAAKPVTLRYDYSNTRSYRSIVRYLPNHPDVVFRTLVRSRDVSFEELETIVDRFITERVRPARTADSR
jgi:hypothetical protein